MKWTESELRFINSHKNEIDSGDEAKIASILTEVGSWNNRTNQPHLSNFSCRRIYILLAYVCNWPIIIKKELNRAGDPLYCLSVKEGSEYYADLTSWVQHPGDLEEDLVQILNIPEEIAKSLIKVAELKER